MIIGEKSVVSIHYSLKDDQGAELDSSSGMAPLTYLHGMNQLIPGLEKELTGKKTGDSLHVVVEPEDAYGNFAPELIQKFPLEAFQEISNVEPGMQIQVTGRDGQIHVMTVQEMDEQGVTLNGNHPLAGQRLHFDVTIDSVREATEEELEHGHAH